MLRSGAFWLGVGAGAVVAWIVTRHHERLLTIAPHSIRTLSRRGRRGQSWPGQPDAYSQ